MGSPTMTARYREASPGSVGPGQGEGNSCETYRCCAMALGLITSSRINTTDNTHATHSSRAIPRGGPRHTSNVRVSYMCIDVWMTKSR